MQRGFPGMRIVNAIDSGLAPLSERIDKGAKTLHLSSLHWGPPAGGWRVHPWVDPQCYAVAMAPVLGAARSEELLKNAGTELTLGALNAPSF